MQRKPMRWLGVAIATLTVGLILTLVKNDSTIVLFSQFKSWGKASIFVMNKQLSLWHPSPSEQNGSDSTSNSRQNRKPKLQSKDVSKVQKPILESLPKAQAKHKKKPYLSGMKPYRIVHYGGCEWMTYPLKDCDIPCVYSSDKSDRSLNTASAIVFCIPHLRENARKKLNGRGKQALTVGFSMESSVNCQEVKNLSKNGFDLVVTYSFDSDVPAPYYGWERQNLLKDVSEWPWEKREPAVVFIANNCQSSARREILVQMLQKYVRVDSVAACMNNHPWPSGIPRSNKEAVLLRYRVYLAAENVIDKDYVTEKVYGALINGAVPIYLGAPNVEELVPSHSIIPVPANFTEDDVIRIAGIVKQVITNKTFYEEWIEFKKHPYEERFERKVGRIGRTHVWCRLCRKLYALKNGYGWDKELQQIVFD